MYYVQDTILRVLHIFTYLFIYFLNFILFLNFT